MSSLRFSNPRLVAAVLVAAAAGVALLVSIRALLSRSVPRPAHTLPSAVVNEVGTLSGRVVSSKGRPVGGARVWIHAVFADLGDSETVADAEGVFRFPGIPTVAYAVTAKTLDARSQLPRVTSIGHAEPVYPSAPPVDIVVARLLPIRGTVVDSAGRPLAEVDVEVTGTDALLTFLPRGESLSAVDGGFEVWAPEGATVDLHGIRRSSFVDMVTRYGPTALLSGVQPGSEGVVLSMPDDR